MKLASKIAQNLILSLLLSAFLIGGGLYVYLHQSFLNDNEKNFTKIRRDIRIKVEESLDGLSIVSDAVSQNETLADSLFLIEEYGDSLDSESLEREFKKISTTLTSIIKSTQVDFLLLYGKDRSLKVLAVASEVDRDKIFTAYCIDGVMHTIDICDECENMQKDYTCRNAGLPSQDRGVIQKNGRFFLISKSMIDNKLSEVVDGVVVAALRIDKKFFKHIEYKGVDIVQKGSKEIGSATPLLSNSDLFLQQDSDFFYSDFFLKSGNGENLIFRVLADKEILQKEFKKSALLLILVFSVALLISIPLSIIMVKREVVYPIDKLVEAISNTQKGKYKKIDIEKKIDEITFLKDSFNSMMEEVKKREQSLVELNRSLAKKVDEGIKEGRKKDEIIFEQNRTKALADLLVNIAHQWRQPLNAISLGLYSIEDIIEFEECDKEKIDKVVSSISNELQSISSLITDFTKIYGDKSKEAERLNLSREIEKAFKILQNTLSANSIKVVKKIDDSIEFMGVRNSISEIFIAIFTNIIDVKQRRELSEVVVEISAKKEGDFVVIKISDNAGGVKPELLPTLFDPYVTTEFKSRNKGLGLFVIKNIIENRLDGTISAKNLQHGLELTITLNAKKVTFTEE